MIYHVILEEVMAKASRAVKSLPVAVAKAVELLGRDIAAARTRRRIPQRLFAERVMVTLQTVQRLEHGDPGVSVGVLATALWVLGMNDRLSEIASPARDTIGTAEDIRRQPRRVRTPPISNKSDLDF
jgi:transcriptional regulator with XRE-family HTH domain